MHVPITRRRFTAAAGALLVAPRARAGASWRLATGYRAESFHTLNIAALASAVDAATGGELRIAVHPNNGLVKLAEIRATVEAGQVEAGETIITSLVREIPIAGADAVLAEGRIDSMITSAVTGVENKVWSHVKHYYEINAWFPKNLVFANAAALAALPPRARTVLLEASATAEQRGWAASAAAATQSLEELRRNAMKVERTPPELGREIKRLGERFSVEWIRQVGAEANEIFIPYFTQT